MRIFISYSQIDQRFCVQILDYLSAHEIWYDQRLVAGDNWWDEILKRLDWCDAVILVLSPNSLSSKFCREEYSIARAKGKRIIPILIEPCNVPSEILSTHYVDMTKGITLSAVSQMKDALIVAERTLYHTAKRIQPFVTPSPDEVALDHENEKAFRHFPVLFNPETVTLDYARALEEKDTDTARYLLEQAVARNVQVIGVDFRDLLRDLQHEIDKEAYARQAEREYKNIAHLVKNRATFEKGMKAFEKFLQYFPDYDPQKLVQYLTRRVVPNLLWCDIPEGEVTLEYGGGRNVVYDVATFRMSKHPITNAQFQMFIDNPDGYANERWWLFSKEAARWHRAHPKPLERHERPGDHPRVGVSWYEAMAFCLWLSHKTGLKITLPTEYQWQRAAQGDDRRLYPYGKVFSKVACNARQTRIRGTTAVTAFPMGASPFKVMDMAGNTWDWTLSLNKRDPDPAKRNQYIAKGGSYSSRAELVRVTYRFALEPDSRYGTLGFRVVALES